MEYIVKELCKFILDNLYDDVTLNKIEEHFYYSRFYLMRLFKECTGYTIVEFVNTVKVLKSMDPLIYTDDMILKIALNNGYNSQEYYSEKFQEVIGVSPLNFRKMFNNIEKVDDIETLEFRKEYLLYLKEYKSKLLNMGVNLEKIDKVKNLVK